MLDDKSTTVIFANVEDILLCNTVRARSFHPTHMSQLACVDVPQLSGSTAKRLPAVHRPDRRHSGRAYGRHGGVHGPSPHVSYLRTTRLTSFITDDQPYCVHQSPAIKVLQGLRETNTELASHLQASSPLHMPRRLGFTFWFSAAAGRGSRDPELGPVVLSVDSDAAHYAVSVVDEAGAQRC